MARPGQVFSATMCNVRALAAANKVVCTLDSIDQPTHRYYHLSLVQIKRTNRYITCDTEDVIAIISFIKRNKLVSIIENIIIIQACNCEAKNGVIKIINKTLQSTKTKFVVAKC